MGGTNWKGNISIVPRYKHEAWHLLFDNLPALQVFEKLLEFYDIFGANDSTIKRQKIIAKWTRERPARIRKKNAWNNLFGEMDIVKIVRVINKIWIDPDYKIILKTKKVLVPRITTIRKRRNNILRDRII